MRRLLFWMHLACGLVIGSVVLVMSVTGILLTYEKQMSEWADHAQWQEPTVPGRRASVSQLMAAAEAYEPSAEVSSLVFRSDPLAPVALSIGGRRTLYLDPSTAEARGESSQRAAAFFSAVRGWHRWFNISGDGRSGARTVTGWSNLMFLFLILSGLYLWMPRQWTWKHIRPVLLLRPRARGKARDFNWHHVAGLWFAVPLAIVVASATVISFPWASDLAYRIGGDDRSERATTSAPASASASAPAAVAAAPTVPGHDDDPLDAVVSSAVTRVDEWRSISVSVPDESETQIGVRIDQGWGGQPQKRHTLTYDARTGRETSHEAFADQSGGRRFRTFLRFAHTGEFFGLVGQTVAGLASLAGVLLVYSGFALAWRRFTRWIRRRRERRPGRERGPGAA